MASPDKNLLNHEMTSIAATDDINQQILESLQLKREQEIQKQRLWHTYQEKNKEMELRHKMQLEHKYQVAVLSNGFQELREQQFAVEEQHQRERREREARERRKDNNCNANASTEVKQKLQSFLMKKQAAANGTFRNWGVVKSSSGESLPTGSSASAHPYKIPPPPPSTISKYDSDFPLRKTASEPNIPKLRLKQSLERKTRVGQHAMRRQERILQAAVRRQQKQLNPALVANCSSSTPDSGPNSPPALANRGSPTSAPIQEENEDPQYQGAQRGSINDLSLFSSPSMPNISLGRSHLASSHTNHSTLMLRPGAGHPLVGGGAGGGLYYTSMPPIEMSDLPPQAHATPLQVPQLGLHHVNIYGRTQSAPLPLGHPMLTGAAGVPMGHHPAAGSHYEATVVNHEGIDLRRTLMGEGNQIRNFMFQTERPVYVDQQIVIQKLRQSVLARSGREPQLKEEETSEVIDLTDKKQPPKTVLTSSVITSSSASNIPDERFRDQEYLQQQRELLQRQISAGNLRPLSRTLSSPLVHMGVTPPPNIPDTGQSADAPPVNLTVAHRRNFNGSNHTATTGLAYDNLMLKHACSCDDNASHPEHSGRLQSVWARLVETGLANRCDRLRSRKATQEEIQTVHTEAHTLLYSGNQLSRQKFDASRVNNLVRMACGGIGADLDTPWNEQHTAAAARMAAGCVIDLVFKTAKGDIRNGFAVVRPPGHHAEAGQAMGFCIFNSVAIAAKLLLQRMPDVRKILIVDWDVHHGNGTQQAFYDDPNVLYLSIHRHDDGNFFPGTGDPTECGDGTGLGFNVNIAWSGGLNPPLGDAEYLAAFRTIVMPIAKAYNPDIVLVSAGFDPAIGHPAPLGGYIVSPACFGHLTRDLMQLADGKVVLALEGGYDLPAICDSAQECVRALLCDEPAPIADSELSRQPCENAIDTLQKTIAIQTHYWPCLKRLTHTVAVSALRAIRSDRDESETVTAMAGLSMQPPNNLLIMSRPTNLTTCPDSSEPMEQDELK